MDVLTDEQCWELLSAARLDGWPWLSPDALISARSTTWCTRTRSFQDRRRQQACLGDDASEVAFEIDGYDEATNEAWSVVVAGIARVLSREADLNLADTLPLFPWNLDPKHHYVAIDADSQWPAVRRGRGRH
ncbi:MAG: hypothetical protein IPN52_12445 [Micrococcales bacterium]|nr:hypothetical protein [Micrococcales bacterium]